MQELEQRSGEWLQAKLGKVGCSRLGDVLAVSKRTGEPLQARIDYMMELLCERLTGVNADHFKSAAMEWGVEYEPQARTEYEARNGVLVDEHGGQEHPTIAGWWCSPDGLVGDDGGIEIKCPNTATHLDTLINGTIKEQYIYQMAGAVLIYDRAWWDFVSYDPRLPDELGFYCRRFTRDELPLQAVKDGVIRFLDDLSQLENRVYGVVDRTKTINKQGGK